MSTITLNKNEYKDLDPKFIDGISLRLTKRLTAVKATRIMIDQLAVTSELSRLFGAGLTTKIWYKDFVVEFCKTRKIPCDIKNI